MDKDYESLGINTNLKSFKRYKEIGLLNEIDEKYIQDVKEYWKKYYNKEDINPTLHIVYANLNQSKDPRVIPAKVAWNEIIPFLNDQNSNQIYQDKNFYDRLIPTDRAVESVLRRIHGLYFNVEYNQISKEESISVLLDLKQDLIVKPSRTNNGKGIKKLKYYNNALLLDDKSITLESLEEVYGNDFIVQKVIEQHPIMAAPHPSSVNTLRMVTLRWKNQIEYLLTFARFGAGEKVQDNAGTGGVCVGVNDKGEFKDRAINERAQNYNEHPTTGYSFSDMPPIPNFDKFKEFTKDLHKKIPHHDFISWDIAVGADGLPVFLEANFRGATWLYQLASQQPLFGDLTDEVLSHISKYREDRTSDRWKELHSAKLTPSTTRLLKKNKYLRTRNLKLVKENDILNKQKSENEKFRGKVKQLKKENKDLSSQNKGLKKEIINMKNSRSWKVTKGLRKLKSKIKK